MVRRTMGGAALIGPPAYRFSVARYGRQFRSGGAMLLLPALSASEPSCGSVLRTHIELVLQVQ
jgi:hypothetical protein